MVYKSIFENIQDGVVIHDFYGCILDLNAKILSMNQYTRQDSLGKHISAFLEEASGLEVPKHLAILKEKGAHRFTAQAMCKNGDLLDFLVDLRVISSEGNGVILSVLHDITEERKIETALHVRDQEYRALVNNLPVGVYRNTTGAEGRFLQANPALVAMLGFDSSDDFLKMKVSDLYQNREERIAFVKEISEKGAVRNKELRLAKKDGTPIWASVTAQVSRNDRGEVLWIDGIVDDITERKILESEVKKSTGKLQEQAASLEKKTVALAEIIEHIEHEKKQIKEQICNNIHKAVIPLLKNLRRRRKEVPFRYIDLLEQYMLGITHHLSPYQNVTFSPREMEINDLIKKNLSSKEIAELLTITLRTVETHRRNIRKKAGLRKKRDVNLAVFLQNAHPPR